MTSHFRSRTTLPQPAPAHISGEELGRHDLASYRLTLCRFPAAKAVPTHAHARAHLCFLLEGGYIETYGARRTECRGPLLALHPPGEPHSNRISEAGSLDLIVEIQPERLRQLRQELPFFGAPAYVR